MTGAADGSGRPDAGSSPGRPGTIAARPASGSVQRLPEPADRSAQAVTLGQPVEGEVVTVASVDNQVEVGSDGHNVSHRRHVVRGGGQPRLQPGGTFERFPRG